MNNFHINFKVKVHTTKDQIMTINVAFHQQNATDPVRVLGNIRLLSKAVHLPVHSTQHVKDGLSKKEKISLTTV